ncbi:MAG: AmpG family muropeptide MFS transporter [Betaproteobacteria bacterium]|nr:MAG: AmpG family muropeptide MFS transporter [Betaproteobacteria bacterium]
MNSTPGIGARLGDYLATLRIYTQPRVVRMLFLGFSAGLPLLLVFGTLSFWLREAGVDLSTIGFFSLVGLVYGFKWTWSPLVDQLPIPLLTRMLGKRRSWLLAAQLVVALGLCGMALSDPALGLQRIAALALLTAFASATQDIALDAFRIESAEVEEQGAMAAAYQAGYRGAMLMASAGALLIAAAFDANEATYEQAPWAATYFIMAALMGIGIITVLLSPEPMPITTGGTLPAQQASSPPGTIARLGRWLVVAFVLPFVDFIKRYRYDALLLLALIGSYRISDVVMGVMANPFYYDMGFTKEEIATISKVYGVIMTLVGAGLGGVMSLRIGVVRTLFIGALLSAATNLLFAWLATRGHDLSGLVMTISADNLSAGIASAAFIAYLSGLTNIRYSATQYALFSSVMLLLPKFIAGGSGVFVERYGYETFFTSTALLGVPVLVLIFLARNISMFDRGKLAQRTP